MWTIIINKETGRTKVRVSEYSLNINNRAVTADEEAPAAFDKFFVAIPLDTTRSLNSSSSSDDSMILEQFRYCQPLAKILRNNINNFNKNKLLHNKEFGFTKDHLTTDANIQFLKHIFGVREESCDALGIFFDLSMASASSIIHSMIQEAILLCLLLSPAWKDSQGRSQWKKISRSSN